MCYPNVVFLGFYQSVKAHRRGPFLLAVRSEGSFASEAEAAFKEKALAPCKSIGQIAKGAELRVALQEVTETHS